MKVIHIATEDAGGAGKGVSRLHLALNKKEIKSELYVSKNINNYDNVFQLKKLTITQRVLRRLETESYNYNFNKFAKTKSPTLELFSDDRVPGFDRLTNHLPQADVYNLHWVAGFLDYKNFFHKLPTGTPLVWKLPDMFPFTGGCHYSYECDGFTNTCGQCPQLGSSNRNDLSAKSLKRKKEAFLNVSPITTTIVAPSKWTQKQAQISSLLSNFEIAHIPNGIDCEIFIPREKTEARAKLNLPTEELIVLFVADAVTNYRKGFDLLQKALSEIDSDRPITLASIGSEGKSFDGKIKHIHLGRIESEEMLSFAYSAADIFVTPARAESFGLVVIEAMACGTPVVGFEVGGIPDMVRPGQTGLLAKVENVREFKNAIETLLKEDEMRSAMSRECRHVALAEYTLDIQADKYKKVYESLIEKSRNFSLEKIK